MLDTEKPFKHITVVTTLWAQESSGINGSGIVEKNCVDVIFSGRPGSAKLRVG